MIETFQSLERKIRRTIMVFDIVDAFAQSRRNPGAVPRPLEPLEFWLTARNGQTVDPPIPLAMTRNPSGYHIFFGERLLPDKKKQDLNLPAGNYTLQIRSLFYQLAEQLFTLPMPNLNQAPNQPVQIPLQPGSGYLFPTSYPVSNEEQPGGVNCAAIKAKGRIGPTLLRGSLHQRDGKGLEGAGVEVVGVTNLSRTDANGQWVLWFSDQHPSGLLTVRVTFPDNSVTDVVNVCVVKGRETYLRQTALRGWVTRTGRPIAGAGISVQGRPGQVFTVEDGSWFYYFGLTQGDINVVVEAQLNGVSQLRNVQVKGRSTVTVDTFQF
jgi:hypothetical protein